MNIILAGYLQDLHVKALAAFSGQRYLLAKGVEQAEELREDAMRVQYGLKRALRYFEGAICERLRNETATTIPLEKLLNVNVIPRSTGEMDAPGSGGNIGLELEACVTTASFS
jgi:hypothetical protein